MPTTSSAGFWSDLAIRARNIHKPFFSAIGEHISPPRVIERMRAELFLISYPKTGRTWLRMLMKTALHRHYGVPISDPLEFHELSNRFADMPRIAVVHDDEPHWKRPAQLTTDKSRWYHDKRVILMVRDPRDTIVSLYHQMSKRWKVFRPEWVTMSEFFWSERGGFDTMIRYYNIWADQRDAPRDLLMVRYEDLHADTAGELRRVLDFLGVRGVDDSTIADAIEENRIERVRKREAAGEFRTHRLQPGVKGDPSSMKARKGKIGGFVEELPWADVVRATERIRTELDPWYGYDGITLPEQPADISKDGS
ncbi:MAG: sulfotransferase domain-containing protein [Candidatus Dadabacteria bacterium]|nr:MAG: sulfotransferase domain-containing protein [Candidatus Dadabacteria bacterium]